MIGSGKASPPASIRGLWYGHSRGLGLGLERGLVLGSGVEPASASVLSQAWVHGRVAVPRCIGARTLNRSGEERSWSTALAVALCFVLGPARRAILQLET